VGGAPGLSTNSNSTKKLSAIAELERNQTPMNQVIHFIGLDVHKESVAVSIAPSDSTEVRFYGTLGGQLADIDRLIQRLAQPGVELRFCYEAGPTGYPLCRHLRKRGFKCEVVAPSLIPKKATDRVKTNRRDSEQLARLLRAGELTGIYVPDAGDEAIRDLVRCREAARVEQLKARQRLKGFLLRHGFRYAGKSSWTEGHRRYLATLAMPFPAQQIAFQEYIEAITVAGERLARLTKAVEEAAVGWKCEPVVRALMSLRGVNILTAMILVAEAGDLTRFDSPVQLMSYLGLTSCEESTGDKRWQGGITKCGNGACRRALVEAAQHYRLAPRVAAHLQKRQEKQSGEVRAIAFKAQQRLHARHKVLSGHRKKTCVVVTALARELCGFVWAIACQVGAPQKVKRRAEKSVEGKKTARVYELNAGKTFVKKARAGQDQK
jgi:transposase